MAHASESRGCLDGPGDLSLPAAVLDEHLRYLLLNRAASTDPLLAKSRVGDSVLACAGDEPASLGHAFERRRRFEHALRTGETLCFEESGPSADGASTRACWLCLPFPPPGPARLVVVRLPAPARPAGDVDRIVGNIHRELHAPLATLVALTGSLAGELTGPQRDRAVLVERTGRRLLYRLGHLLRHAEASSAHPSPAGPS